MTTRSLCSTCRCPAWTGSNSPNSCAATSGRGISRSSSSPRAQPTCLRRFRGYEAGAVDFIQKPIEADVLRSKADVFFDLYHQRRQVIAQRDELAAMTERLQAADRQKNRFLAILGHELRNPIMALSSGLHLLAQREGTEAAREIRSGMARNLKHVTRLVEDLLEIARIDQGKILLRKERLNFQDVLAFAIDTARPAVDDARHTLHSHGAAGGRGGGPAQGGSAAGVPSRTQGGAPAARSVTLASPRSECHRLLRCPPSPPSSSSARSGARRGPWLKVNLNKHPDIYAPPYELDFWADRERWAAWKMSGYRRKFEGWNGEAIVGEASPSYMFYDTFPFQLLGTRVR